MTIQWTLVASFLYLELAFICVLLLPFISSKVWQYVFYSRFCKFIASKANIYFTVFIIVLLFFFLDSIREMLIYSSKTAVDLGQELQVQIKLFRSQRNYYISGFTVFLWLVIRRLVTLVLCEADLLSENETAMKRAQNATETVEKMLKSREEIQKEKSIINEVSAMEANALSKALEEARKELENTNKATEDVTQKCISLTKEYEVLQKEHNALLNKSVEVNTKSKLESKNEDEETSNVRDPDREISDNEEEEEED